MIAPEPVIRWARAQGVAAQPRHSPGTHRDSAVWQLGDVFLKICRSDRAFTQETTALRALAGCRVPTLLAEERSLRAVLLSEVVGEPVRDWEAVGRWLRTVHACAWEPADAMSLSDAWQRRAQSWCDRARGVVPGEVVAAVAERCALPIWQDAERVLCHRDVQPSNLKQHQGEVWGLDLEHARADGREVDVVKLAVDPAVPLGRVLDGYGAGLDLQALLGLCALHGLATWVWGASHHDDASVAEGRRVVDWVLAEPETLAER